MAGVSGTGLIARGGANGHRHARTGPEPVSVDHRGHAERLRSSRWWLCTVRARKSRAWLGHAIFMGTIPQVRRLLDAFRGAGRPVVHIVTTHDPAYADAQWPHWRSGLTGENRTFLIEGSWGAEIVDELKPQDGEHIVIKKGYGGFSNTPLDTNSPASRCHDLYRSRSDNHRLCFNDAARRRRV